MTAETMEENYCNTVTTALDEMNVHYKADGNVFHMTDPLNHAGLHIRIDMNEEFELLTVTGCYPIKVAEGRRFLIGELIDLLNGHTEAGAFNLDSVDGELSFRLAHSTRDVTLDKEFVKACCITVIWRLRDAFKVLMEYMSGGEHEAIASGDNKD